MGALILSICRLYLFFSVAVVAYCSTVRDSSDDRVNFPAEIYPDNNVTHYSGYLDGESSNIKLHYWLVEASENPETAPLFVWFNGGPGCSSLYGLLSTHGPFLVSKPSKLKTNPYSWNKIANIIYLESPAGVGFSYAEDGNIDTNDDETTRNNYHALVNFVKLFPKYRNRDFYITGESYAGVFIPLLGSYILNNPFPLKLKGLAISNGVLDWDDYLSSRYPFLYQRNLIDETMWNDINKQCCDEQQTTRCHYHLSKKEECQKLLGKALGNVLGKVSPYSIYSGCPGGAKVKELLWASLDGIRKAKYTGSRSKRSKPNGPSCTDDFNLFSFLNNHTVKEAIHVKQNIGWEQCNDILYEFMYDRQYNNMKRQIEEILQSDVAVLLFSGDTDMVVPVAVSEWFFESINGTTISQYTPWYYKESDNTNQVGGYRKVKAVGNANLTHATVLGAGHATAVERPLASLSMMKTFVKKGHLP